MVAENSHRAEENSKMLSEIKSTLTSLDQKFSKTTNGFADDLKIKMQLDITFFDVQRHVRKIQSQIESLSIGITSLSLGLLSAELFPPDRFLEVLRGIQKHLPSTWHLAIPATFDNAWTLYQGTRVLAAATVNPETKERGLRLFLHLPIYENALQFALYRVYNVPTYNANASHGLIYENVPDLLAISLDLETFVETSDRDLDHCVKTTSNWVCPTTKVFQRVITSHSCVLALFQNDPIKKKSCTQILTPRSGIYSTYLGDRQWIYSGARGTKLTYTCSDPNTMKTGTVFTKKTTLMEVPRGCTLRSPDWIIPSSFQVKTVAVRKFDDTEAGPFNDSCWTTYNISTLTSKEEKFRQGLLDNVTIQLDMLERTEGKHQYKGMSVERLRYLANLLEEDAGWKFTLKMLATETRDLRRRVREHDLLLGVAARVTRV